MKRTTFLSPPSSLVLKRERGEKDILEEAKKIKTADIEPLVPVIELNDLPQQISISTTINPEVKQESSPFITLLLAASINSSSTSEYNVSASISMKRVEIVKVQPKIETTNQVQPKIETENLMNKIEISDQSKSAFKVVKQKTQSVFWKWNDYNNTYQSYILGFIRKIDEYLGLNNKYAEVFKHSFVSRCFQFCQNYERFDPEIPNITTALMVVQKVLESKQLSLTAMETMSATTLDFGTKNVDIFYKKRGFTADEPILDQKLQMIDKIFSAYPDLKDSAFEIDFYDFRGHAPASELMKWAVAAMLVAESKNIFLDSRVFSFVRHGTLESALRTFKYKCHLIPRPRKRKVMKD